MSAVDVWLYPLNVNLSHKSSKEPEKGLINNVTLRKVLSSSRGNFKSLFTGFKGKVEFYLRVCSRQYEN